MPRELVNLSLVPVQSFIVRFFLILSSTERSANYSAALAQGSFAAAAYSFSGAITSEHSVQQQLVFLPRGKFGFFQSSFHDSLSCVIDVNMLITFSKQLPPAILPHQPSVLLLVLAALLLPQATKPHKLIIPLGQARLHLSKPSPLESLPSQQGVPVVVTTKEVEFQTKKNVCLAAVFFASLLVFL